MNKVVLSRDELSQFFPHRYENILLDQVVLAADGMSAEFEVSVTEKDDLGRQIFFESDGTFLSPVIMEVLALASIVATAKMPDGYTPLFAAISRFRVHGTAKLGEVIRGSVHQLRGKSRFLRYMGYLNGEDGRAVGEGEMMAYYVTDTDIESDAEKKTESVPPQSMIQEIDPAMFKKDRMMVMTNQWTYHAGQEYWFSYRYPLDHPFVKGHFPEKPVMMGVMQWMTLEDAIVVIARTLQMAGDAIPVRWTGQAKIVKENGTLVAEIKNFVVAVSVEDRIRATLISTDKVVFRDQVLPGQVILTGIVLDDLGVV